MRSLFLTLDEALHIHEEIIKAFGGMKGIRDKGALEAALFRPQSGYYKNLYEEAGALMESLCMNHPFIDGNKRVAFFSMDVFLRLNGHFLEINPQEAYAYLMNLFDTKDFKYNNLVRWIEKYKIKI